MKKNNFLIKQGLLETDLNQQFNYYHCAIFSAIDSTTYDIFIKSDFTEDILKISSVKADTTFYEHETSDEFKILAETLKKHSFLRANQ